MSIIFISHKLNEVLEIADRITVLRRGKKIETVPREGATEAGARAGDGRARGAAARREAAGADRATSLLEVEDLHVLRRPRARQVRGRLVRVARGRDRRHRGRRRQRPDRADRRDHGPAQAIESGTRRGRRPRGRAAECARGCSTRASATSRRTGSGAGSCSSSRSPRTSRSTTTTKPPDARCGWLFPRRLDRARAAADPRVRRPRRRTTDARRRLSGGNQQKVVAAREIARDPKVLIAAQPTRGLDVGAIEYLHRRLVESATRAARSCSSRSSWTRCCRSPTASSSSTRARSSGEHGERRERSRRSGSRCSAAETRGRRMSEARSLRTEPARAGGAPPTTRRGSARRSCSQRGRRIAVPVVTAVVAFADRRPRRPRHGPQPARRLPRHPQRRGAQLALRTRRTSTPRTRAPTTSRQTLLQTTTLDPDGPRGRVRLPLRAVQHRRPGPVLHRGSSSRAGSGRASSSMAPPRTSCSAIGAADARRRRLGRDRRLPEGRPSARTR